MAGGAPLEWRAPSDHPYRLRRLHVDDEGIARRLLERQLGRLGALEDAVDQGAGALEGFLEVGAVRHQAAVAHQEVVLVDRRQALGGGVVEHALAIERGERVGDHQDGVRRLAVHRLEHALEIVRLAHAQRIDGDAERAGGGGGSLVAQRHAKIFAVPQHRHARELGRQLLEQRQALDGEGGGDVGNAGDGAARPRQALDHAGGDRIADAEGHDRRYAAGLGDNHRRIAGGDDGIDARRLQFLHELRLPGGLSHGAARLVGEIAADRVAACASAPSNTLPLGELGASGPAGVSTPRR